MCIRDRFEAILTKVNLPEKKASLALLEAKTYDASLWKNPSEGKDIMQQIAKLKRTIDEVEMMQLLLEEDQIEDATKLIDTYEIQLFLSGPHDVGDCIFGIHAGQGGTEAMDWAQMLYRMYTRFFEQKGWKTCLLYTSPSPRDRTRSRMPSSA